MSRDPFRGMDPDVRRALAAVAARIEPSDDPDVNARRELLAAMLGIPSFADAVVDEILSISETD